MRLTINLDEEVYALASEKPGARRGFNAQCGGE
jgi:hypothetical protein